MGFIDRVTTNVRLMLQRPPRQQYAALCYRVRKKQAGQLEVLVMTSRDTGRWVIPKGWPMEGKKAHAVAEREAYEEAGVKGKVSRDPLGHFHYRKTLSNGVKVPVLVQVHALEVEEMLKTFPEKGSRKYEWVSCEVAASRVNEPELKILFMQFGGRMYSNATEAAASPLSAKTAGA